MPHPRPIPSRPIPASPAAAVFDLDGTLFHSAPGIADCLNAVLEADGRRRLTVAETTMMIGDGSHVLLSRAYEATGGQPDPTDRGGMSGRYDTLVKLLAEVPVTPDDLYPGVRETLTHLAGAGIPMAVCTNKPEAAARHALGCLGIADFFKMVIGGDSVAERKPDPLMLTTILDHLTAAPDRSVMVGDSANDLKTAHAADVACILVSFGYSRDPIDSLDAEMVIDDFTALRDLLA